MKGLQKLLYTIAVAVLFLFTAWWIITALGVAEIIGQLLWTSLTGWYRFTGFTRLYLLGGAITVIMLGIAYGIPAIVTLFRDFANDWISIIVAVVVLGCIPIIAIPLVTVGWPLLLWLFIADQIEKRRKASVSRSKWLHQTPKNHSQ